MPLSLLPPSLSLLPGLLKSCHDEESSGSSFLLPPISPSHNPATSKVSAPYVHPEIPSSLNCFPLCGVLFCLLALILKLKLQCHLLNGKKSGKFNRRYCATTESTISSLLHLHGRGDGLPYLPTPVKVKAKIFLK